MNYYPVTAWTSWFAWWPVTIIVEGKRRVAWLTRLERSEVWFTALHANRVHHAVLTLYRKPLCSSYPTEAASSSSKPGLGPGSTS